ncbi:MAG: nucleotidyltransferase family protein [Elusimicrobia bacterium]|nr:nucleotidyltransferase family protein [Elusimicrobiota bacterium]
MILAAGVGSRMRPLTDSTPKALVPVAGVPMLERVIQRLAGAGVREIIVNVHHLSPQIAAFLKSKDFFGLRIELSLEDKLLDTGGGLKKASWFFDDGRPFLLHNVDVYSTVDFGELLNAHEKNRALATLSVRERQTSSHLLFDAKGRLRGRESANGSINWAGTPLPGAQRLGFDGIHALSPEIFPLLSESGAFSIIKAYLRLAAGGQKIRGFRADAYYWADVGSPEKLEVIHKNFPGNFCG